MRASTLHPTAEPSDEALLDCGRIKSAVFIATGNFVLSFKNGCACPDTIGDIPGGVEPATFPRAIFRFHSAASQLGKALKASPAAALPYDQHAIQLDRNFAMGYRAIGDDYFSLGELGRASEYLTKAFQLREHASEREKLGIAAEYYHVVTGELDKSALWLASCN
jgi:hypothetical protein